MPFTPSKDYWVEIPGGQFMLGLLPEEARRLAEENARQARLDPPTPGLNDWKNIRKWTDWEEMDCNVEWLTEYLLAHYPARNVEQEPFAIARRPITNAEYRIFMAEMGELEPGDWGYPPKMEPDQPACDIDWVAALRFAEWAGARLPFEDEWERIIRGRERRLFPWGDRYRDHGRVTATPDGIETVCNELCVDIWQDPSALDHRKWDEEPPSVECRVLKGGSSIQGRSSIASAVARCPAWLARYGSGTASSIRLVRADGRSIPARTRELARHERALLDVRAFEMKVVGAAFEQVRHSRLAAMHTVDVASSNDIGWWLRDTDPGAKEVRSEVCRAVRGGVGKHAGGDVRAGFEPDPVVAATRYNDGLYFVARSRESVRRIPAEHGVFVWSIGYRLADDGQVRARHIAGFHLAFNKRIHTLTYQFRDGEVDTPIRDISADMVAAAVLSAFDFYEAHADADRSPF